MREVVSYGRRKGRTLSIYKKNLWEQLLPQYYCKSTILPQKHQECWLEIGFGAGEHILKNAELYPDILHIGCETYVNGVAQLLAELDNRSLSNIRIYPGDVQELLNNMPELKLHRVYILCPDPWPKKKHARRRMIQQNFLTKLASHMLPEAMLVIATDHADYAEWICENLKAHQAFELYLSSSNSRDTENTLLACQTRYMEKAMAEGGVIRLFNAHCINLK